MNEQPCGKCNYYDVILRGTGKGLRPTSRGWCAKKSIYPIKPGPGQVNPPGVKRVTKADEPAKPHIVAETQVVGNCTHFMPQRIKLTKEELIKKIQTDKKGKQVIKGV